MGPRPEISLSELRAFVVVAEERHFGRAAARLAISQPPLSQLIRRLEGRLGCMLLDRDTRNVRLTEAGVALDRLGRKLLEDASDGVDQVRSAARGEAGRLVVAFTATTALHILPAIIQGYRAAHPAIDLSLIELLPDAMVQALEAGSVDVALGREMKTVDGIVSIDLMVEPDIVVLPAAHRLAGSARVPLAALRDEAFVLFPRDRASRNNDRLVELCMAAGFLPHVVQEAPGWQTAVSLVGSGLGVSILPHCTRSLALPGVVYRDLAAGNGSIVMLLRRRNDERALVARFIDSARAVVANSATAGAD